MTIDDIIHYRAQQIIMAADYTTNPPQSPNLVMIRERYPLTISIDELNDMLWAESEKIADDIVFNDFR